MVSQHQAERQARRIVALVIFLLLSDRQAVRKYRLAASLRSPMVRAHRIVLLRQRLARAAVTPVLERAFAP